MPPDVGSPTSDVGPPAEPKASRWSYIGVGCLTAPIGFFGGGMIAVLVAKLVGAVQDCKAPDGLPACNTFEFLYSGALIGLIGLPLLSVVRLRAGRIKAAAQSVQRKEEMGGSR
jgi:hypothetical protein